MFVPIPVLIAIGVVFLLLVVWALRSSRGRDPLMGGGQPPAYRAAPAPRKVSMAAPSLPLPPEVEEQVRALMAAGRKIDAIKLARDVTHLGLKETKDLVESFE
ncbi:MAG: ribosomal protein L7/L12 [Candidatus Sphingomonas phytovorans]|nr:ribosomal protein L7/L12 [Sphingomonas sp.]WEJ98386.1 MAG: ribosomal protein L7/L12 [Sphingomonas sp.]